MEGIKHQGWFLRSQFHSQATRATEASGAAASFCFLPLLPKEPSKTRCSNEQYLRNSFAHTIPISPD